ncbi:MAG: hypothetical protein NC218_00240 [Acetobacter sp.]|nr:hypothetical protein [Acetobacter sp.]
MMPDIVQAKIAENRVNLTNILLEFVKTDTILYAFNDECLACFSSEVEKANRILGTAFISSCALETVDCNCAQGEAIREYLKKLSNHKFIILYLLAVEFRSVLLSILFVERMINREQLLQIAFYEERYQQKQWGTTKEMYHKYKVIDEWLTELEKMRDENNLFEN